MVPAPARLHTEIVKVSSLAGVAWILNSRAHPGAGVTQIVLSSNVGVASLPSDVCRTVAEKHWWSSRAGGSSVAGPLTSIPETPGGPWGP